nr:light harvesting complex apoprotein 2 - potato [Solanum tuberosum]
MATQALISSSSISTSGVGQSLM